MDGLKVWHCFYSWEHQPMKSNINKYTLPSVLSWHRSCSVYLLTRLQRFCYQTYFAIIFLESTLIFSTRVPLKSHTQRVYTCAVTIWAKWSQQQDYVIYSTIVSATSQKHIFWFDLSKYFNIKQTKYLNINILKSNSSDKRTVKYCETLREHDAVYLLGHLSELL